MKRFVLIFLGQILLISAFAQKGARKITYRYKFDLAKATNDPILSIVAPAFEDKYLYKTYLCYNGQSIAYSDETQGEKVITSLEHLESFSLQRNKKSYEYTLSGNDGKFDLLEKENDKNVKILSENKVVKYGKVNCFPIRFGLNNNNVALVSNNYPPEWGCVMLSEYNGCILKLENKSTLIEMVDDVEIDSMLIIRLLKQTKSIKTKKPVSEKNILQAETGGVSEGSKFPRFVLKDLKGNIINWNDQSKGFKILLFWSDFSKDMLVQGASNLISYNKLLKEFDALVKEDLKVISCFWNNLEALKDFIPEYQAYSNTNFVTSTQSWCINNLGIKNLTTVVVIDSNNVVRYKGHMNIIKGEVDNLKRKIDSFKG